MYPGGLWLCLCALLGILAAPCWGVRQCLIGTTINVILLEDKESPWSLKFVRGEILKAIATESAVNTAQGNKKYKRHGTRTSACVQRTMMHR